MIGLGTMLLPCSGGLAAARSAHHHRTTQKNVTHPSTLQDVILTYRGHTLLVAQVPGFDTVSSQKTGGLFKVVDLVDVDQDADGETFTAGSPKRPPFRELRRQIASTVAFWGRRLWSLPAGGQSSDRRSVQSSESQDRIVCS